MYHVTVFKNRFDNRTYNVKSYESWPELVQMFKNLSVKKGSKGGNNSSPLISPALYVQKSTRSNRNVERWSRWCAVDVDDFDIHTGDVKHSLQSICGNYSFVCYSTASSTPINPKFRLVFPLTREIDKDEIPHFWYAFNKHLKDIGDKQTKDLSRMYYVPAEYPEAFNFIFTNDGDEVDPDYIMSQWSYKSSTGNSFLDRLPPAMAKAVIEHRKEQMDNNNIVWSDYRDCPFFPRQLAIEYQSITDTGWYHKMYQIMVATAANAIKRNYPITAIQVAELCRQLDRDNGMWYDNRPLEKEADRAVEYAYRNV
jgi:hypothetical protein